MSIRLSSSALAALATEGQRIAQIRPAEFVPMVSKYDFQKPGEITGAGCGLVRQPAGFTGNGLAFLNRWTATDKDPLSLHVHGIGITHEPGGPVEFTVAFTGHPHGTRIHFPGDVIEFADVWPPAITIAAT